MRAAFAILAGLLAGCSSQDPTAEQFSRAKAYCEKHGLEVYVTMPFFPTPSRLQCTSREVGLGRVRIPEDILAAAAPPEGKES